MTTGIEVRSLQAGYDDNIVIDELNLTIPKDSITALIGANGCGKSTLLKTICRICVENWGWTPCLPTRKMLRAALACRRKALVNCIELVWMS